jgi:O-antigen ligase
VAEGPEAGTEGPRKRKERGGRNRMAEGYAKAEVRNQEARAALEPLAAGERPPVVSVGAALCALVALSIVVTYLAGVKVNGETPKFAAVAAPVLITGVLAWGMWRARYWAALGFQVILVFLIFCALYGLLVEAESLAGFAVTVGLLALTGTLFLYMVKAMARIQMPERAPPQ